MAFGGKEAEWAAVSTSLVALGAHHYALDEKHGNATEPG